MLVSVGHQLLCLSSPLLGYCCRHAPATPPANSTQPQMGSQVVKRTDAKTSWWTPFFSPPTFLRPTSCISQFFGTSVLTQDIVLGLLNANMVAQSLPLLLTHHGHFTTWYPQYLLRTCRSLRSSSRKADGEGIWVIADTWFPLFHWVLVDISISFFRDMWLEMGYKGEFRFSSSWCLAMRKHSDTLFPLRTNDQVKHVWSSSQGVFFLAIPPISAKYSPSVKDRHS